MAIDQLGLRNYFRALLPDKSLVGTTQSQPSRLDIHLINEPLVHIFRIHCYSDQLPPITCTPLPTSIDVSNPATHRRRFSGP
jgi:hypothetical protein